MPSPHPTADQLFDFALDDPSLASRSVDTTGRKATQASQVAQHIAACEWCRLEVEHLQAGGALDLPDDGFFSGLVDAAPSTPDNLRRVISAISHEPDPQPDELWRVGQGFMQLAWVRNRISDRAFEVVPVSLDVSMSDHQSLILNADEAPVGAPIAVLAGVRVHVHVKAFANLVGRLDIATRVDDVITSRRKGIPTSHSTGHPVVDRDDPRIEYFAAISDVFETLSPDTWAQDHLVDLANPDQDQDAEQGADSQALLTDHAAPMSEGNDVHPDPTDPANDTHPASELDQPTQHQALIALEAELKDRLGSSVRCAPCHDLVESTPIGIYTAFATIHYIDTSVLVVTFQDDHTWLPTAAQTALGVRPFLATEAEVQAVAVTRAGPAHESLLMTRSAMRPAVVLPDGLMSEATLTYEGLTLVDSLVKYLDGEPTAWEVITGDELQLPPLDIAGSARQHAAAAIEAVRKSGGRSPQPLKRQAWTELPIELADVITQFITASSQDDHTAANSALESGST